LNNLIREVSSERRGSAEAMSADLTDPAGIASVEDRIRREPLLALLVNNAGMSSSGLFTETEPHTHETMLRLHVAVTTRLTHAALLAFESRSGDIINVSSSAAFRPSVGDVLYSSTKSWIVSFTKALAIELREAAPQVRLQVLCPSHTLTDFHGPEPSRYLRYVALKPDEVVTASLRALNKGKVIVAPTCIRHEFMLAIARCAAVAPRRVRQGLMWLVLRSGF
jgi:short-subunit dehydrogenase